MTSNAMHAVDDADRDWVDKRAQALRLFELQYANPRTRETMLDALRRVARTFSQGQITDEAQFPWELLVDAADVLAIRAGMLSEYQRATVARDLVALKQILRCCWRVGLLNYDDLCMLTDLPRLPAPGSHQVGRYLAPEDLGALVAACRQDTNRVKGLRDATAILAAASTGMRREELVNVADGSVDIGRGQVHLTTTKGGRDRTAYLHPVAAAAIEEWRHIRGPHEFVFTPVTRSGNVVAGAHLSAHQFWKMLRTRAQQVGLPQVSTHDLRRFTISQLLGSNDLSLVSRVVGHQSPATTARYDVRPDQQRRAAVETLPLPPWPAQVANPC